MKTVCATLQKCLKFGGGPAAPPSHLRAIPSRDVESQFA
jgi:hypothetical protein